MHRHWGQDNVKNHDLGKRQPRLGVNFAHCGGPGRGKSNFDSDRSPGAPRTGLERVGVPRGLLSSRRLAWGPAVVSILGVARTGRLGITTTTLFEQTKVWTAPMPDRSVAPSTGLKESVSLVSSHFMKTAAAKGLG